MPCEVFLLGLGSRVLYGACKGKGKVDQPLVGERGATGTCSAYLAATARVILGKCDVLVFLSPRSTLLVFLSC